MLQHIPLVYPRTLHDYTSIIRNTPIFHQGISSSIFFRHLPIQVVVIAQPLVRLHRTLRLETAPYFITLSELLERLTTLQLYSILM